MLGIFLIYFIGKKFAELAEQYDRHKWGYGILGVVAYYLGTIIFGVLYVLYIEFFTEKSIDEVNEHVINFMAVPFGLLICWIVYRLLESAWKKKPHLKSDNYDFLDDGLLK